MRGINASVEIGRQSSVSAANEFGRYVSRSGRLDVHQLGRELNVNYVLATARIRLAGPSIWSRSRTASIRR